MATIKDIAKLANVSIGTVDRVIHKRGTVANETLKKVEQAIKELNYKPNIHARQLKLGKKYKFGVLIPEFHQDASYWEQHAIGMRKAGKELETSHIDIKFYHFDRYSEPSFYDKFSVALEDNLDGMLIAPIFVNPAKDLICQIPENIPYIFFDSDLPESKRLTFIGQDAYKSGVLAGKLMKMMVHGTGDLVIIRVLPESYNIDQRVEGFRDFISDNGSYFNINIYEWQETENLDNFHRLMSQICDNENLRGIFMTNALTYPVASHIGAKKDDDKIKIIGYDLVKENINFLKNSVIDFLICQSPITQGYQGILMLYKKLVLNQDVENKIMMPIDIVTKENAEYYTSVSRANI
ncbi:MAG: LacI family DNA-binding transcriptional regulator [Deferribacteres bacterium]|nr:LacI family DNA-binding transcriptional regulator [candidate division KSB1 bacterium]MCB9501210.1 LacI family DNA-binding transcriptional regulator [Deferribacteres bacterium]